MKSYIRVWKSLDLKDIESHLLVVGELSCECFSCHKIGIKPGESSCPNCGCKFKYVGFRKKINSSLIARFKKMYPDVDFVDFEDFKKAISKKEAKKILDV